MAQQKYWVLDISRGTAVSRDGSGHCGLPQVAIATGPAAHGRLRCPSQIRPRLDRFLARLPPRVR